MLSQLKAKPPLSGAFVPIALRLKDSAIGVGSREARGRVAAGEVCQYIVQPRRRQAARHHRAHRLPLLPFQVFRHDRRHDDGQRYVSMSRYATHECVSILNLAKKTLVRLLHVFLFCTVRNVWPSAVGGRLQQIFVMGL